MHIEWIVLSDFRNYPTLSYSPTPHLNVITGLNGQGKTNLLEGLGLLLVGRSFRGSRPAELVRWDSPHAAVSGVLRRNDATRTIKRMVATRDDGAWIVPGEGCPWARVIPFGWPDLATKASRRGVVLLNVDRTAHQHRDQSGECECDHEKRGERHHSDHDQFSLLVGREIPGVLGLISCRDCTRSQGQSVQNCSLSKTVPCQFQNRPDALASVFW